MFNKIAHISLVVKDYDKAIDSYAQKLDFVHIKDTRIDESKRWVIIAPTGAKECCLLLAKVTNEKQFASIGNQTGSRSGWIFPFHR
ncbi:VOC family protein [Flagellimonas sp. 389]|uniref:VOC family protein n=1 Tax=Flagellimonas sp. 389 TaxID=2835862 RepID=UPI001BD3D9C4|nr:VOC family protein [Flagellimonas sp. 389]MBS9461006.1 VOC family protein [Flagellimonas sp. 389]